MLCGIPPFYNDNLINRIKFPKIKLSVDATDIIQKLLEKDPHKRLGSKNGIEEIKNHPFFKSINFDLILRKEVSAPFIPEMIKEDFNSIVNDKAIYLNMLYFKDLFK